MNRRYKNRVVECSSQQANDGEESEDGDEQGPTTGVTGADLPTNRTASPAGTVIEQSAKNAPSEVGEITE